MSEDRYNIVRRIDWIRNRLCAGQPFNSTDLISEFKISARTAYRDIHFVRKEYFVNRLKYDIVERTYYLITPKAPFAYQALPATTSKPVTHTFAQVKPRNSGKFTTIYVRSLKAD